MVKLFYAGLDNRAGRDYICEQSFTHESCLIMHTGLKTKELIEKTALSLFVQKGITETTIRDIASSAEIAEGTMYRHFASKEELAWEIFSKHFTAFALELEQVQKEQGNLKKKIEAMVRDICAFFDNDPVLFSYLFLFAVDMELHHLHSALVCSNSAQSFQNVLLNH